MAFANSLGFIDLTSLIPTIISTGGQVASAFITKEASEEIAKTQKEIAKMQIASQERLAQLQLEALRQSQLVTQPSESFPELASVIPSQVFSLEKVLLFGLLAFLLLRFLKE